MISFPKSPSESIALIFISFYVFEMIQFIRLWLNWKKSFSKYPSNIRSIELATRTPVYLFFMLLCICIYVVIKNLLYGLDESLFMNVWICWINYGLLLSSLDDLDGYITDVNLEQQFYIEKREFKNKRRNIVLNTFVILVCWSIIRLLT